MTFTLCTAPNGPKSCHKALSSVSGAKLYMKMLQPPEGGTEAIPLVAAAADGSITSNTSEDIVLYKVMNEGEKIMKIKL